MTTPGEIAQTGVDLHRALAVADSVLYEGYLLYPYRASSQKNRIRWQFGVLAPRAWIEDHETRSAQEEGISGSTESWWNRTECLIEADLDSCIEIRLRYLQLATDKGAGLLSEALPREAIAVFALSELLGCETSVPVDGGDRLQARMVIRASRPPSPFELYKITLRVENTVRLDPGGMDRDQVLPHSLVSAHVVLGAVGGSFVSLIDPPEWALAAARTCRNVRAFPVLAGAEGTTDIMLSAPIILYDHPQVAPESPGDLFDATEIDEILSLRTMTLTDAEKAEARATDPRAREIVDRVDSMPEEVWSRLHGAVRSLNPIQPVHPDGVVVAGVELVAGSKVRLRPRRRGTDAQDMFVAGRVATVDSVLTDVDGSKFLAVSIDGDPRAELDAGPGRFMHFAPDEVEPLQRAADGRA